MIRFSRIMNDVEGTIKSAFVFFIILTIMQKLLITFYPEIRYSDFNWKIYVVLASIAVSTFVSWNYLKTEWMKFLTIIAPYCIYLFSAFGIGVPFIIKVALIVGMALSLIYCGIRLCRRIKCEKYKKQIIKRRLSKCISISNCIITSCVLIATCYIDRYGLTNATLLFLPAKQVIHVDNNKYTLSKNIDIMKKFHRSEWNKLDVEERLKLMQIIMNIETRYLGIPHKVNLVAKDLPTGTSGSYIDAKHTIYIDLSLLKKSVPFEILETCCHEIYHCYQLRLVDAYLSADDNAKRLQIHRMARKYIKEFEEYNSGEEDFYSYYNQQMEEDAREYAKDASEVYFSKYTEYMFPELKENVSN